MVKDADVEFQGTSLGNYRVLLVVTGGIAAVESVKLSRELRRHGATINILMTSEAEKIITPLALSWASGTTTLTGWDHKMSQLDEYDAILVAPATRNTISKHIHGIIDSPATMALSAARGSRTSILFVPSMHADLFDDPVTTELIDTLRDEGSAVMFDEQQEGRRKQPDAVAIVAELCNVVNSKLPDRKTVAITLGANRAPIDAVRAIQNASSGSTGWTIAQHLHRMGHTVICVVGKTSVTPEFKLPDVRLAGSPDEMLATSLELACSETNPDAWIHSAAVLDYYTEPLKEKKASGEDSWEISLSGGPKHIAELAPFVKGARRIGFKLETGVSVEVLIDRAMQLIERHGVDAVVANLKEEIHKSDSPRGRIVLPDGTVNILRDDADLCEVIESLLHGS
jgi:phosphopantothenoylcysteine decarboxylase/phosphopantothenate--cysteine ligase